MSAQPTQPAGPLAGVRILDLTAVVLGPMATQILGDYGADVIKVENLEGDMMRANGITKTPGLSSIFLAINRNKRSLALDLKTEAGRDAVRRLLPTVDVVVHNMRVSAIERLGLGYEALKAIHPGIVYVAATGFGQDGPHRSRPAFDDIVQAGCGLVALNGAGGRAPDYTPSLIADKTAGVYVANAVLAALFHRERTGQGQYVEVPMLETLAAFVLTEHLGGLTFPGAPEPAGYPRLLQGGRRPTPTKDGYMSLLPYTQAHWRAFFEAVGRNDLAERYDVENRRERNARIRELYAHVAEITPQRTTAEWLDLCESLDIPATPIYALDDLPEHPHLKAVGLFAEAEHPVQGSIRYVRPTTLFDRTPAQVRRQAPTVGQDSSEILGEAGYTPDEIGRLKAAGVVGGR
ncbi:CoA transferase [Verticiella sediminum]|uniref:CoA transferase n=1 Tax=Verticiella sediminum TaxID=1247510 RepID=A0A556AMP4_9BURK|nr:CoA transferase [Verticiella sediminum]TSH94162.1 CoA transferase [Verticiella sediminum]